MGVAFNENLEKQIKSLEDVLKKSNVVQEILRLAPVLKMPNWYLGAGCISQTVWNFLCGFELTKNIKDCDLVYYDSSDLSYEKEDTYIQKGKNLFKDIILKVEIINEARVHLWYEKHFGHKIKPYESVEEAISSWPTTATCVGVKYDRNGKFLVYAPFGLKDLLSMIVRPNKVQIKKEVYLAKTERWKKAWPRLGVIPWES